MTYTQCHSTELFYDIIFAYILQKKKAFIKTVAFKLPVRCYFVFISVSPFSCQTSTAHRCIYTLYDGSRQLDTQSNPEYTWDHLVIYCLIWIKTLKSTGLNDYITIQSTYDSLLLYRLERRCRKGQYYAREMCPSLSVSARICTAVWLSRTYSLHFLSLPIYLSVSLMAGARQRRENYSPYT